MRFLVGDDDMLYVYVICVFFSDDDLCFAYIGFCICIYCCLKALHIYLTSTSDSSEILDGLFLYG